MPEPDARSHVCAEKAQRREDGWDELRDVPLRVAVEVARATLKIRDVVGLGTGSLVRTAKAAGEPMDVSLDGRVFGRAEVVLRGGRLAARITRLVEEER